MAVQEKNVNANVILRNIVSSFVQDLFFLMWTSTWYNIHVLKEMCCIPFSEVSTSVLNNYCEWLLYTTIMWKVEYDFEKDVILYNIVLSKMWMHWQIKKWLWAQLPWLITSGNHDMKTLGPRSTDSLISKAAIPILWKNTSLYSAKASDINFKGRISSRLKGALEKKIMT